MPVKIKNINPAAESKSIVGRLAINKEKLVAKQMNVAAIDSEKKMLITFFSALNQNTIQPTKIPINPKMKHIKHRKFRIPPIKLNMGTIYSTTPRMISAVPKNSLVSLRIKYPLKVKWRCLNLRLQYCYEFYYTIIHIRCQDE